MAGLAALVGAGCNRSPAQNDAPITAEERRQIEEADRQIEQEESAVDRDAGGKKGRRPAREP
jgi:hypothetical protein